MEKSGKVEGKMFLVTGGASGMGAGHVASFLKEGAEGVAILDINEEAGSAYAEQLNEEYPGKVTFVKCDCSNEESLTAAFDEVVNKFRYVDAIINNAGIMPLTFGGKPNGVVSLTLKGIKHMSKDEGGRGGTIINVASIAAVVKIPFLPVYAGTKAGVLHFTNSIASGIDENVQGVRVMSISYGTTNTPLIQDVPNKGYLADYADRPSKPLSNAVFGHCQKPESAVKALVAAYKQGSNGSAWLSTHDRPARDITPTMEKLYNMVLGDLYPESLEE